MTTGIDMGELDDMLDCIQEDMMEGVNDLIKEAAIAIFRDLIDASPVDSGRFRASWDGSLGDPSNFQGEPPAPGRHDQPRDFEFYRGDRLEQFISRLSDYMTGQDIWIVNNLDYADLLANGLSPQATPGWFEAAVFAAISRTIGRAS